MCAVEAVSCRLEPAPNQNALPLSSVSRVCRGVSQSCFPSSRQTRPRLLRNAKYTSIAIALISRAKQPEPLNRTLRTVCRCRSVTGNNTELFIHGTWFVICRSTTMVTCFCAGMASCRRGCPRRLYTSVTSRCRCQSILSLSSRGSVHHNA